MAAEERGYFATLGVTFRSDDAAISKAYKKLALKMHPDKNPGPAAVDEFQKITTSYHVLMDEQKRKNYLRLFMLRCYMSQECPRSDMGLRPHYAFMVEKSSGMMGGKSDRLLTFDLLERKMQTFQKDTLKKEFALSALTGVAPSDKPLELTINFKDTHSYYIRARCPRQYETLLAVLRRIVDANARGELSDESLELLADDASSPPSSVHKSKVIKRAERSVGSSLVAEWQPRFMVMGTTQLIIFRDVELQHLVNILPLSMLKFVGDGRDRTCFVLSTSYWKASFRVLTDEVAGRWKSSLAEQQAQIAEAEAADGAGGRRTRTRTLRPSVIFTEGDLANVHRPPKVERMATEGDSITRSISRLDSGFGRLDSGFVGEELPALPPPALAPWESEFRGGWIKYRDDLGRPYYYNKDTAETTWTLPVGLSAERMPTGGGGGGGGGGVGSSGIGSSGSFGTAGGGEALPSGEDGETVRLAQMAALQEESEPPRGEESFAQAKGSLLNVMQSLERGLLKARRGVEADRPLNDLAPMFEQLRETFVKLTAVGKDFERSAMGREDTQRAFMTNQAAYLSGLHAHVLGEDAGDSVASKIFKKGAYVADTFNRMTNMRGVL